MSAEDRENIHLQGTYSNRKKQRDEMIRARREKKAKQSRMIKRTAAVVVLIILAALVIRLAGPVIVRKAADVRQQISAAYEEHKRQAAEKRRAAEEAKRKKEEEAARKKEQEEALKNEAASQDGTGAVSAGKPAAGDAGAAHAGVGSLAAAETAEDAANAETGLPAAFNPHPVKGTEPENLIASTKIMMNDTVLSETDSYKPWYHIDFGAGDRYTDMQGVITFRGDSFRNAPAFGTADMQAHMLNRQWTVKTGSRTYKEKTWTGSGWTGQPLLVKWPKETKAVMNMYDWAKEDDELVEVIYACLDGKIYFLDLKTGEATREVLDIGFTFKGSGALDPRGLPVLYVGSGYNSTKGRSRAFIISLIDGSVLYTFGDSDGFADRSVSFFDSSPLVDAASDTLIWPGENGVLYLIHLNSKYNEAAGTLSVDPDRVCKWKYMGKRTGSQYWVGMETSASIYGGYLFVGDNGGNLMCLDLNTLKLVWVQDTLDDTNSSPVLSAEDGKLYLYIGPSFHKGWRGSSEAVVPVFKIDAETGEIVWQKDYNCHTQEGVSGGIQSTIALGKNELDNYIYVTVSMTKDTGHGVLACIEKKTGNVVWEQEASYAWSSPVCVYKESGSGAVLYCSSSGKLYLLDGLTGEEYDMFDFDHVTVEASPAVYENYAVLGTRDCQICGFRLE